MAEFGPGVVGRELPVDGSLIGVDVVLSVVELVVQFFDVRDPAEEALARERGEPDFCDV